MVFKAGSEAKRFVEELEGRFAKFGLKMRGDKTRVIGLVVMHGRRHSGEARR